MEALASYFKTMFTPEGSELTNVVVRWILLYAAILLAPYVVAGRVLSIWINRMESRAQRALKQQVYAEVVRVCARILSVLEVVEPLYRFPTRARYCYQLLGDALLAMGNFQSALYSYQKRLLSEIAVPMPTSHEAPFILLKDAEMNIAHYSLLRNMGIAALRCGCVSEAVIWLERCLALDPTDGEVLSALEEAYLQLRRRGQRQDAGEVDSAQ